MIWDRWDIVEAHFWFCVAYHGGQGCPLYARQCRISAYFTPSPLSFGPSTENALAIYEALSEAHDMQQQRLQTEEGAP